MMQPVLDTAIGLRWEETWCCDRYRTALDLGWEHHIWFDYSQRYTSSGNTSEAVAAGVVVFGETSFSTSSRNVAMGGLVVRLRFDF